MRFLILMLCSLQLLSVNGGSLLSVDVSFTVLPTTSTSSIKQFNTVHANNFTSSNSSVKLVVTPSLSTHGVISSSYTIRSSSMQYSPSPSSQSKHIKLFSNKSSTLLAKSVTGSTSQPTAVIAGHDGNRTMNKTFTLSSSRSYIVPHTSQSSVQLLTSSSLIGKVNVTKSTSQSVIVSSSESVVKQSKTLSSSVGPSTKAFITMSAVPSTTQLKTSFTNQHIGASTHQSSTPTTSQFSSHLNSQSTPPATGHVITITTTSSNKGTLATSLYPSHTQPSSSMTSSSFVMPSSEYPSHTSSSLTSSSFVMPSSEYPSHTSSSTTSSSSFVMPSLEHPIHTSSSITSSSSFVMPSLEHPSHTSSSTTSSSSFVMPSLEHPSHTSSSMTSTSSFVMPSLEHPSHTSSSMTSSSSFVMPSSEYPSHTSSSMTSSSSFVMPSLEYPSHTSSSITSSSFVMPSSGSLPTKGPGSSKKSKNKTTLIVGLSVGITLVIILFVAVVVCYRRKRGSHQYNVFYDEQNIVMNPFDGPK